MPNLYIYPEDATIHQITKYVRTLDSTNEYVITDYGSPITTFCNAMLILRTSIHTDVHAAGILYLYNTHKSWLPAHVAVYNVTKEALERVS